MASLHRGSAARDGQCDHCGHTRLLAVDVLYGFPVRLCNDCAEVLVGRLDRFCAKRPELASRAVRRRHHGMATYVNEAEAE